MRMPRPEYDKSSPQTKVLQFGIRNRLCNFYAIENCGGARLDWKLTGRFEIAAVKISLLRGTANNRYSRQAGLTWAHCETVIARQQSWLQQLAGALSWDSWVVCASNGFRMQQACGAGVVIAKATGVKTLTSNRIKSSLAV
jgi:hypothetical protein